MNLSLDDKAVLVTGSSRGLGKATATRFLEEGARVVVTGSEMGGVEETYKELSTRFDRSRVTSFVGDLTRSADIQNCVDFTVKEFGAIEVLVSNIGNGKGPAGWTIGDAEWQRMMDLNFSGARRVAEAVLPHMIGRNEGSIVFVASIAGKESIGAPIHYAVAKASLIAYAKMLSHNLQGTNIRVNSVCPGNIYVEGGTWDRKLKEDQAAVKQMLNDVVPLRRFAEAGEIADLTVFLSSERASFITGSCFIADGGQTVSY